MKIILLTDVAKVGKRGQLLDVAEGYAQNFLISKGLAKTATPTLQKEIEKNLSEKASKQKKLLEQINRHAAALKTKRFTYTVKVGSRGEVFGAISGKDIADSINRKLGSRLEKSDIQIPKGSLKSLGTHQIEVKFGHGLKSTATIELVAESK